MTKGKARPCRNCRRALAQRAGLLCPRCYRDPEARERYPPLARPSVSRRRPAPPEAPRPDAEREALRRKWFGGLGV